MEQYNGWTECKVMVTTILFMAASASNADAQVQDYATDPFLPTEVIGFLKTLNSSIAGSPRIRESQRTITSEGYTVKLNLVRPAGIKQHLPVFVFIHGGSQASGGYPAHQRMVRELVAGSGCAGIFVNHTPSTEANYPQAIHEMYAVTKWVAEHGAEIGVDGEKLVIVGNSVGGNMTAVTALMTKAEHGPRIRLQIMMWPVADASLDTASKKLFGEPNLLSAALMKWMFEQYQTYPTQLENMYMPSNY